MERYGRLETMMDAKPLVFFDMDGTLADFDRYPGVFDNLPVMDGAIEAVARLRTRYRLAVASTTPWGNDDAASAKLRWIKRNFGGDGPENPFYKDVTLTHHKERLMGDYLVDDWPAHGAREFRGELIEFGSPAFPDWKAVADYLMDRAEDEPAPTPTPMGSGVHAMMNA